jgi:hypothetical protein
VSHRDFANIEVGDTVIVRDCRGRTLQKVAKVTRTQFSIESGIRFMRSDGGEYGGDQWHRKLATIPSADDIAAVRAEQRQERAVSEAFKLRKQIETALNMITSRRAEGWGPTIEASNDHLRRALEALQVKQEELL